MLTPEQIAAVVNKVNRLGQERRKNFGINKKATGFNQADFIAGAAAVLEALESWEKVPPNWILGTLMGMDVFKGEEK